MDLFLGPDVGTRSVGLLAYEPQLRRAAASAAQPLEPAGGSDASREQRAEGWVKALRACFARIGPASRVPVAAIGASGQQHGFVPLDQAGSELAPAKLGCGASTGVPVRADHGRGRRRTALHRAGRQSDPDRPHRVRTALDLRHRSQAYAKLATILLPHDDVNFWLAPAHARVVGRNACRDRSRPCPRAVPRARALTASPTVHRCLPRAVPVPCPTSMRSGRCMRIERANLATLTDRTSRPAPTIRWKNRP